MDLKEELNIKNNYCYFQAAIFTYSHNSLGLAIGNRLGALLILAINAQFQLKKIIPMATF